MSKVIPVFRVFDHAKTIEFYVGWLGCTIEWEHREENAPFYMRVALRDVQWDLSEHHGECSPGGRFSIEDFKGLEAWHQELIAKQYPYMRPGLERVEWDPATLQVSVIDPFYNRIIFNEKP